MYGKKLDNVHAREIDPRPPLCTPVPVPVPVPVPDIGTSAPEYNNTLVPVYSGPDNITSVWSRKGDQTSSSISRSTHHCTQGKPDQ